MKINPPKKSIELLKKRVDELLKKNYNQTLSAKEVDQLLSEFENLNRKELEKYLKELEPSIRRMMKNQYTQLIKSGNLKITLRPYSWDDMTPKIKKQLKNATENTLSYIKGQDEQFIQKIKQEFRNWGTLPSKETRGINEKQAKKKFNENVLEGKTEELTAYQEFIMLDQTRKFAATINRLEAEEGGAFAFEWDIRGDKRVVGNPTGIYPKGNAKHGNHWERDGKLYLLRDSWAVKKGYVKAGNGVIFADEIPDGMPSVAVGCRCLAHYVFTLHSIPEEYKFILTKEGKQKAEERY